ncbi:MAG: group 1 truncated hemoglobin [Alphaproteobacteria bacterium]|nr:group 1 truncated hemoglobin [Alphaproteobacteria bacterium]
MTQSLFEKIGGKPAVDAAVDLFYEKVLADPRINHFFTDVDMTRQRSHQKAFLAYAFGGMESYEGRSMREAHKHLDLNEEHFGAVAEHLQATLEELGVPEDLTGEVMTIAANTHDDVLNL